MIIYSKSRYVVSFLGLEKSARVEGNLLILKDKSYQLRPMEPREVLIASLLWLVFLSLNLYLYPFSSLLVLDIKSLLVWIVGSILCFITFYARVPFLLGAGIILVALVKLTLVFDYVAGMIGGFSFYVLYLISSRALITQDGLIIIPWTEK